MVVLSENIWKHPEGWLQGFSDKIVIKLDEGELHINKVWISVFVYSSDPQQISSSSIIIQNLTKNALQYVALRRH